MKKILIAVAVLLVTAGTLFAGEMTIGVRGALSLSGNKWANGDFKDSIERFAKIYKDNGAKDGRKGVIVGGGADVFFRYDFLDIPLGETLGFSLGVQPEIGIHAGWGANEKLSVTSVLLGDAKAGVDFTYNTLDIPILITAGLNINKVRVNIAVGPNFGFVLAPKFTMEMELLGTPYSNTESVKTSTPVLIGMQAGAGVSYNFTKNHGIVLEVRGIFDFTDLKMNEQETYFGKMPSGTPITRRAGALISLGYAYTF